MSVHPDMVLFRTERDPRELNRFGLNRRDLSELGRRHCQSHQGAKTYRQFFQGRSEASDHPGTATIESHRDFLWLCKSEI